MTRLLAFLSILSLVSCEASPFRLGAKQPLLIPVKHNGGEAYQVIRKDSFARKGCTAEIPEGLIVDGASVPRAAWCFMSPDGLHRRAALCHDVAYGLKGEFQTWSLTRKEADEMFYDFMVEDGVSRFRAGTAYNAVRVGGWLPWRNSSGQLIVIPVADDQHRFSAGMPRKRTLIRHLYAAPALSHRL